MKPQPDNSIGFKIGCITFPLAVSYPVKKSRCMDMGRGKVKHPRGKAFAGCVAIKQTPLLTWKVTLTKISGNGKARRYSGSRVTRV